MTPYPALVFLNNFSNKFDQIFMLMRAKILII